MLHPSPTKLSSQRWIAALIAGLLFLAGCDSFNDAYYKAQHTDDDSALAEQSMDRHYLNGDINAQQFQQQVKVFNPNAQLPETTSLPKSAPPSETNP